MAEPYEKCPVVGAYDGPGVFGEEWHLTVRKGRGVKSARLFGLSRCQRVVDVDVLLRFLATCEEYKQAQGDESKRQRIMKRLFDFYPLVFIPTTLSADRNCIHRDFPEMEGEMKYNLGVESEA